MMSSSKNDSPTTSSPTSRRHSTTCVGSARR
jgi:hypothetical protein